MSQGFSLWRTQDLSRAFLIPDDSTPDSGPISIRNLTGDCISADEGWLRAYEVTDDQARRWAKDQLGQALGELKDGIDEKLADLRRRLDDFNRRPVTDSTTITPNAGGALFELLTELPGVIAESLSADEHRVETARKTMKDLQQRLKEAGIDLDDRFTRFPDRLAGLRKNPRKKS